MAIRKARLLCMTLAILLASTACSSGAEKTNTQVPQVRSESAVEVADSASGVQMSDTTSSGFLGSQFNQEKAVAKGTAYIDISSVANGYVAVSAVADKRLKFQVICGNATYNYDMSNTGKPSIFPLQSGDGQYKFRIMKNVQDKKYAEIHSVVCDVKLSDPYQPFLRPSDYANYSQNSRCVAKAAEITKGMTNDLAKIKAVYEYVCKTVKYDRQKAATVKSGYLPTPDETMATGKGICFDYASLAASMLRSQGIPTKVIFGYVSPDGLYHAWNMFYTKESGWVTVSYSINPSNWTRMDLTFSANGADGKFIGDGGNYKDVYMY